MARMGFEIEYSPERGIVFLGKPEKAQMYSFSVRLPTSCLRLPGNSKSLPKKQALLAAIKNLSRDIEEHEQSGKFRVMSSRTGKIESRRMTQQQLRSHLLKELERLDQGSSGLIVVWCPFLESFFERGRRPLTLMRGSPLPLQRLGNAAWFVQSYFPAPVTSLSFGRMPGVPEPDSRTWDTTATRLPA